MNKYLAYLTFSGLGMIVGAVLFGILKNVLLELYTNRTISLSSIKPSDIVFYGGLTGVIATFYGLNKKLDEKMDMYVVDCLAVIIPLFHSFARMGCFFAGCCYGKMVDTVISIGYVLKGSTEIIYRFPVQLIEAVVNLMVFITLLIMWKKEIYREKLIFLYLKIYAMIRFILEFLRGDEQRGIFSGISFSQIYSICILFCLFMYNMRQRNKEKSRI